MLTAAQAGAEWAWSALYAEYAARLRGYIRTLGVADPDDVLGEGFLQMAKHLSRFEGDEAAFRSWIFVIAHRRVIDHRRRSGRRQEMPLDDKHDRVTVASAETMALDRLSSDTVAAWLAALTPDQREVIALRVVADLSLEDTAQIMRRRVGAVKQLQRRALRTLHRKISPQAVTQ